MQNIPAPDSFNSDNQNLIYAYKESYIKCRDVFLALVAVWMYLGRLKILQSFSVKLADRGIKAEEILYK